MADRDLHRGSRRALPRGSRWDCHILTGARFMGVDMSGETFDNFVAKATVCYLTTSHGTGRLTAVMCGP